MIRRSVEALIPRNGLCLMVAIICRISGCQRQKEASLDDQEDNGKEVVSELYDGVVHFDVIATKGKGENLERPELERIQALYKSGKYDLVIYDDLSRLIRGGEAARLLGIGVDNGTRSICINDCIDTIEDTWEEDALNACSENVAHNQRTSKRVKQKTMNRFKKYGWTTRRPVTAYIAPKGATTYDDWLIDQNLAAGIQEGARILKETLNGEAVAAYFNENGVPVGPYARNEKWDGSMVLRYYRNPLLKGLPQRGKMATVKEHGSGKRVSKKNPKGPTYYEACHLAILDPVVFDELNILLAEHNKHYRRKGKDGVDPRLQVPRQRTRSFGQHARCWYCGRHYVWGGNGITGNLMCSGSRRWNCWNSVGFPGHLAARKLIERITERLFALEGIDEQFRTLIRQAERSGPDALSVRWEKLLREEAGLSRDKEKAMEVVLSRGDCPLVNELLDKLERQEKLLAAERRFLESAQQRQLTLPDSPAKLRGVITEELERLAFDSLEFGDLIRRLVPEMHVYLVRLCDGGHLLPRAKVRLNLMAGFPDGLLVPQLQQLLMPEITIDLFEPPQRERIREDAVRLEVLLEQRAIAAELAEKPKQAAVWKSLELQRRMNRLGLPSPYVLITEPPSDYAKLRHHKNAKYSFEPLEGYQPPTL